MSRYRINAIKNTSPHRKYEYLRETGVMVPTATGHELLHKEALDSYIDERIWRDAHPGQEPIKEWESGIQAKREGECGEPGGEVRGGDGSPSTEG